MNVQLDLTQAEVHRLFRPGAKRFVIRREIRRAAKRLARRRAKKGARS
jgi:hypothetical protein